MITEFVKTVKNPSRVSRAKIKKKNHDQLSEYYRFFFISSSCHFKEDKSHSSTIYGTVQVL